MGNGPVKAKEKDYSINDGGGLYFFSRKNGSKLWRFVYSFEGKRKKIAFGAYPNTTLENARRKAEEAREQIADGVDPAELRKTTKQVKKTEKLNNERIKEGLPVLNSFTERPRARSV